jgi:riboflavin synthase
VFTGLVEAVGTLARLDRRGTSALAVVEGPFDPADPLVLGESVSVSGVCLTVARVVPCGFEADVSQETLAKTSLGRLAVPARVNLERATKLGGRMGGHLVLGHVDATGTVTEVAPSGEATRMELEAPAELARLVAPKGSIAVDGTSLTVNSVRDLAGGAVRFTVMLVPHTLGATTLSDLRPSSTVNLEVDVFARYVERQLTLLGKGHEHDDASDDRLLEKLRRAGYF